MSTDVAGAEAQVKVPSLLFCKRRHRSIQFCQLEINLYIDECLCLALKLAGEVPWYTYLLAFGEWKPFRVEQYAHHRRLLCPSLPGTCLPNSVDGWNRFGIQHSIAAANVQLRNMRGGIPDLS